ncbi:hypothetical protein GALMADRAFT_136268 [Galerina marginata CBS 339.88]|uniref:Uncharacterized protein n=1 Tax=Galerina marginata (strain CBS 339.88) TaxID=685588 RepID=A0A067TFV3_GALM3|nr:hypothetical protein GALMADRAFT_136268 [Galerina marginata CBS 339.88]
MDSNVRVIRSFKKLNPIAEVPETPQYLTHFLPSPPDSLFLLSSSPNDQHVSPSDTIVPETPQYLTHFLPSPPDSLFLLSSSPNDQHVSPSDTITVSSLGSSLGSPFNEHGSLGGSSSQPRLIQPPQSDEQKLSFKFERMETLLKDSEFGSVGEILRILFYDPSCVTGEPDPRLVMRRLFLVFSKDETTSRWPILFPSSTNTNTAHPHHPHHIIPNAMLHSHHLLLPLKSSTDVHVYSLGLPILSLLMFTVKFTNSVLKQQCHHRASTNGRHLDRVNLVTWEALGKFDTTI